MEENSNDKKNAPSPVLEKVVEKQPEPTEPPKKQIKLEANVNVGTPEQKVEPPDPAFKCPGK